MDNALLNLVPPANEPTCQFAPGDPARERLSAELDRQAAQKVEIPLIIGGKEVTTGNLGTSVMPHDHGHVLATYHQAGPQEVQMAIDAALAAKREWEETPWDQRAVLLLKAAELISGKYRDLLNAATMLNQSKNAYQAEVDAACELADFLRFNPYFATKIYKEQPNPAAGMFNRVEYRALEGFVFAVTPFNFTAIGGNLPSAPALMGNVALWKPASTAVLSNYYVMKIFQEAGFPAGVINFLPGAGRAVGDPVMASPHLAGIHFTGSTAVFQAMWGTVGANIAKYRSYPRIVGETGGKDFVLAHPSAEPAAVATALTRAAFEYQGQKCSAASRAYLPKSLWPAIKEVMGDQIAAITMGDPRDLSVYMTAMIDENGFDNAMAYLERAKNAASCQIVFGGTGDKSKGYFIKPTLILTDDPQYETMYTELFAPILTVYLYDDQKFAETLDLVDQTSPYALTGSLFTNDQASLKLGMAKLRHAAGNFYINDKPTAAMVGQQPFGGSRASGTNDKAGSLWNLIRWVSPRTIKETFCPPTDFRYPFMG